MRAKEAFGAVLAVANRGVVCRAGAISWAPDVLIRPDLCVLRRGWPPPGRWIEAIPYLIVVRERITWRAPGAADPT